MYKVCLFIVMALMISTKALANVPSDWIQSGETVVTPQPYSLLVTPQQAFASELFRFYEVTGDLVASLPEPKKSKKNQEPWYLQSMGVELGIEASGTIGLLGLGGEAAIEMVWARTKESLARLQKKYYPNEGTTQLASIETELNKSDLLLDTGMSEATLVNQVDELMRALKNTQNLRHPERIRKGLLREISKLKNWVTELEVVLPESTWRPYKFQTLIKLSAEGMVQPGLEVGGLVRVKLEWSLRPPKTQRPVQKTAELSLAAQRNVEMLRSLSTDFEMLRPLMKDDEYFQLQNVKLGIGVGIEGDIGIAEAEAEVFGNLFWKEFPNEALIVTPAQQAPLNFMSREGSTKILPRVQWRKGLQKAMDISQFIVRTATDYERKQSAKDVKKERDFELAFLEVEFEVTASGSTFLQTISKKGTADLYFVKQTRKTH